MKQIYAHYLMENEIDLKVILQYSNDEADEIIKSLRQYPLWFQINRVDKKYIGKVKKRIYTKIKEY